MREIKLPGKDYRTPHGSYGDQKVAAQYCGMSTPPYGINGEWQHGWIGPERNIHAEFVLGGDGKSYERRKTGIFFVAREDQVDYLKSLGYTRVFAVGLPIVYVDRPKLDRIPGSLLVMPGHSLPETREEWDADAYTTYVRSIASKFSLVRLCVHKSCIEKGNWVAAFRDLGVQMLEGAEENDQNSLLLMAMLLSQFEYVTSNCFGSHLAYASYFGCKVSVSGPRPSRRRTDYESVPFYRNAPAVLDIVDRWNTDDRWGIIYPQFLRDPWDAIVQQEWAEWQLGEQHKKSPRELRRLFGWDITGRISHTGRRTVRALRASYHFATQAGALVSTFGIPGLIAAIQLRAAARKSSGSTRIWSGWGRRLTLRNGTSDVDVFHQHFARKEILSIPFGKDASTVIDLGANIGVSVEVFRRLFPRARIIAVELEQHNAELCRVNHESDRLVSILSGAIWSKSGRVVIQDVGEGPWAYRAGAPDAGEADSVPAFTYRQILEMHGIQTVDVLKMDIEGAEADVLESAWDDIFRTTAVSIIEVHDWIDGIKERVNGAIEQAKKHFDLEVSRSGEFWVIRNKALTRT